MIPPVVKDTYIRCIGRHHYMTIRCELVEGHIRKEYEYVEVWVVKNVYYVFYRVEYVIWYPTENKRSV